MNGTAESKNLSAIAKAELRNDDIGNMLRECLSDFDGVTATAPDSADRALPPLVSAVTEDRLREDVPEPLPSASLRREANGLVRIGKF